MFAITFNEMHDQVTSEAIVWVLHNCLHLQEINADDLLSVLMDNFRHTDKKFPFTALTQQSVSKLQITCPVIVHPQIV